MLNFSLFTTRTDIIIQRDFNHVDCSQTTTNIRSFNDIESADRTFINTAPPIEESTFPTGFLAPSPDDANRHSSTDTIPHQCCKISQTGPEEAPEVHRMSTCPFNNVEHIYPPTPRSTRPLRFQRASYPYSNLPSEVDIPESLDARTTTRNSAATTPTSQKMCEYIFNKIKGWFDRFLSYIFIKPS
ncbi:hypothetical protein BYT27DRAFT_6808131 [Phlegmacium glaucopus]|nr:hypothetical protein BYT27DRAFT_6808131 [Phlegmacium glaucopus]